MNFCFVWGKHIFQKIPPLPNHPGCCIWINTNFNIGFPAEHNFETNTTTSGWFEVLFKFILMENTQWSWKDAYTSQLTYFPYSTDFSYSTYFPYFTWFQWIIIQCCSSRSFILFPGGWHFSIYVPFRQANWRRKLWENLNPIVGRLFHWIDPLNWFSL